MSSSPGGHFGYFLVSFGKTIWFLKRFCTYIPDNTLILVRLTKLCLGVLPFVWGYFEWGFFGVGGGGYWGRGGERHGDTFLLFFSIS